ncbi:alpha/beta fold hydrolase [bacterium]|nr:alpha/beta fold hydrolase [bacterium]
MSAAIGWALIGLAVTIVVVGVAFYLYCLTTYAGVIDRIFAEKPMLFADQSNPIARAQGVTLHTDDGRRIEGSYIESHRAEPAGTVLFLHEYGSDRWMAGPYAGYLLDTGFDLMSIDFCSCGQSQAIPGYESLQWPTDYELQDARAAIRFLKEGARTPDRIGVFGISKGGGVAICLAAEEPAIRAVVTDGAFPVHDMVVHYAMKWVEIFSQSRFIYTYLPRWFYSSIVRHALRKVEKRRRVNYLPIETAVRKRADLAWLLIHGKNDNYIKEEVVQRIFASARGPKELWIVPKAKHNRCLKREGKNYEARVSQFLTSAIGEPISPAQAS